MHIHELMVDYFKREAIPTEYTAYKTLKANPLTSSVNYLAVPWSVLINHHKLTKLPIIRLKKGFAICQHISYKNLIPILKTIGITTLFTPHVSGSDAIEVLPFPHLAVNGPDPAPKDILYSFMGCITTHPTRSVICKLPPHPDILIKARSNWHFEVANNSTQTTEYKNALARSRFSLCPRGTGPSTIRFWESLRAGAIPVLIADAMQLPAGHDWDNTIIRVAESDTVKVDRIVRKITEAREEELRRNCLLAHSRFSDQNLVSNIRLRFDIE